MIYELRIYEPAPGKFDALHRRFSDHTIGLFKKHGVGIFGFWTEEVNMSAMANNAHMRLIYVTTFENLAERERIWGSFQRDPEWLEARAASEVDGPLTSRVHNTLMRCTDYFPSPLWSDKSNVVELRYYNAVPGKLPNLHARFANHAIGLLQKHGMETIGFWTDDVGTNNRIVWMLGFESIEKREENWIGMITDPEWHKARDESEKDGPILVDYQAYLLRPTDYTPRP